MPVSSLTIVASKLKFGYPHGGVLYVLLGLAALAVFFITYRMQRGQAPENRRRWMSVLRQVSGVILLLCIAQPFLRNFIDEERRNHVAVLLDVSQSMTVADTLAADTDGAATRFDHAREAARVLHGRLAKDFDVHLYAVGAKATSLESVRALDGLKPEADRTDLIGALRTVSADLQNESLSAVFLLSDAAHNAGGDWGETLAAYSRAGIRVYPVTFGERRITDLEISSVRVRRKVSKDTLLNVQVKVRAKGFTPQEVPVAIVRSGDTSVRRVIERRMVNLSGEALEGEVTFEFLPDDTGYLEYTVEVATLPGERVTDNNRRPFAVTVVKRPLRVLYMEGTEYRRDDAELWEHQYLEETLREDDIEVKTLLRKNAARAREAGIYWVQHPDEGYPKTKKELYKYDVIISSDIDKKFFTDRQRALTVDFVAKHGGGFIMIGGWTAYGPGGYDEDVIDKMLPVDMLGGRNEDYVEDEEFTWEVTEEGFEHPIMQLDPDPVKNRKIWEEKQQVFKGHNKVQRAKPAATVLARHPDEENLYGRTVIVAVQQYGRGRSMAFTTDTTAGWGEEFEESFGEIDEDTGLPDNRYYKKFWKNAIRWLAHYRLNAPSKLAYIELDKNLFARGERTRIRIRVLTEEYEPTHDADVRLRITDPDGKTVEAVPGRVAGKVGRYARAFTFEKQGRYEFALEARLEGAKLADDKVMVFVRDANIEFEDFALNEMLVQRMAYATGGVVFPGGEAKEAAAELHESTHLVSRHTDRDVWDRWWWLCALIGVLSAEWLLRKRAGLP